MSGRRIFIAVAAIFYSLLSVAAKQLPDSLLTFEKAYYYNIVDMPKSLQIVQTMRDRLMAAEWELDRAEANLWSFNRHFNKAVTLYQKVLNNPESNKSWREELSTLFLITYCYDRLNDERHLSKLVLRMKELAQENQATDYFWMAEFLRGKHIRKMGRKEEGFAICERAAENMKQESHKYKNRVLFIFYTNLANMYMDDGKYREAQKALTEAEETHRQGFDIPALDFERYTTALLLAIKTRLFAVNGQLEEADSTYAQMRSLPYRDVVAESIVIRYLKIRERYADILEAVQYCRQIIEDDGNAFSINMIALLRDEIDAYMGLRQFEASAASYSSLLQLTDSMHVDNLNYFSREARDDIRHEQLLARQSLLLSIGISILIILSLLLLGAFLHHLQTRKKNKAMLATIDELMYYRSLVIQNGDPIPVEMDGNDAASHEEMRRFKEMDKRIMKEELFRNPDFGREDLMRLMGVDKNAIAPIVQKYAHTNVAGYIKMKRMEYAVTLLKEHPELTIAATAEMIGIKSTTTFVNHFKETYGITPSDYRASSSESTPPREIANQ